MHIQDLLKSVQYVTDSNGRPQAVLVNWHAWQALLAQIQPAEASAPPTARDIAMSQEEAAYRALHRQLLATYAGQHVAIYQGQLVDHDVSAAALYLRVRQQYPGQFVLMTPVTENAIETYTVYSPRVESPLE